LAEFHSKNILLTSIFPRCRYSRFEGVYLLKYMFFEGYSVISILLFIIFFKKQRDIYYFEFI